MSFDLHDALVNGESDRLEFKASFNRAEKYGSGFRRIRSAIADYPTMTFSYRESGDGFITELAYREQKVESKSVSQKASNDVPLNVSLNVPLNVSLNETILAIINDKPGIQRKAIAQIANVVEKTVSRHLSKLTESGLIEHRGSKKTGGYWPITG